MRRWVDPREMPTWWFWPTAIAASFAVGALTYGAIRVASRA